MLFGFSNILYLGLLLTNAVAVLSEDRFLQRIGWGSQTSQTGYNQYGGSSVKERLISLINATRTVLRFPLIVLNMVVIVYLILLG